MAKVPNDAETLPKILSGWLECTSVTDRRQQTERRQTDGWQHNRTWTFAKNDWTHH